MGSTFERKYGTLLVAGTTSIDIPIIKRAAVDFAVGADWTPAAGDVKIIKDDAAAANITNLPTAITSGNTAFWRFILTASELEAKNIKVTISDSAEKAIEDQMFIIETFGHSSAMYIADLSGAVLPAQVKSIDNDVITTLSIADGALTKAKFNSDLKTGDNLNVQVKAISDDAVSAAAIAAAAVTKIQNGLSKPGTAQTITAPADMASQAYLEALAIAVDDIPLNPLLDDDARIDRIDSNSKISRQMQTNDKVHIQESGETYLATADDDGFNPVTKDGTEIHRTKLRSFGNLPIGDLTGTAEPSERYEV